MAVYEHTYRRYSGPRTDPRSRFLVIPKYATKEVFRSKLFLAFFVLCFLVPLGAAVAIWFLNNSTFLEYFRALFRTGEDFRLTLGGGFFFTLMSIQGILAMLLTIVAAPALMAADLRNNALPLYLSRPFSRTEYVLGKIVILLALLSAITWIPLCFLFLFQGSQVSGWIGEYGWIGWSLLVGSGLWIVVLSMVGLAVSATVRWKPIASLTLFGFYFFSWSLAKMVYGLPGFRQATPWADVFSPISSMLAVWQSLFRESFGPSIPAWAGVAALLALCGVCLIQLGRKVRAYEVIK
ncbi:MAG: hypothetical protein K0U98_22465 [Deltaproteobacteria bacterium]|nr:hypothetical protein [Deltaproteobacteria bacterium]